VGVDLGIKALRTKSNGEAFEAPKPLKKFLKKQQAYAAGRFATGKRVAYEKKLRESIASVHAKITNIRQDSLHKLTGYLTDSFGGIVIEDLNVKGMLKNRKLSRAVADIGFYEFRRQLSIKYSIKNIKAITY
jgi:putative transposase